MNTETQDLSDADGWSTRPGARAGDQRAPRVRLLYHSDLDRIGSVSAPGAVTLRSAIVGRNEPELSGLGSAAAPRSIEDPQVSREQLSVRWLADIQQFEVIPTPGGRRSLGLVAFDQRSVASPVSPITGPTLLAPGSCIAVGDRLLLGLELARVHAFDDDRLDIVGESEVAWALRDEIRSIAQFGGAVLVTGPTGAGKELVAKALHQCSPRARGPFIPVNCAALPETLVEATLFGHKKGAFTGADTEGKGLFRTADGGTLFLDELGELPLSVQPKLLRVLQDGVVVPVGAHTGQHVDVRVVAATHRDLEAHVREGKLREDLYHRIAAHTLRVPSLAERRFDVPELFVFLLRRLRAEHVALEWLWERGRSFRPVIPIGFIAELMRRPWSGNVRDLGNLVEQTARQNLHPHPGTFNLPDAAFAVLPIVVEERSSRVEQAVTAAPDALLRAAAESLGLAHKTVAKLLPPAALLALAARDELDGDEARVQRLEAASGDALVTLLEAHDYNQSAVAAALGTSRTTLIKLMSDLALPRAADLGEDVIAAARAEAGGDLDAAARLLRVSPSGLKKRLTLLNLKRRA